MTWTNTPDALEIVFAGAVATALLDLWSLSLNRVLGFPATNWGHVGRWVAGLPSGSFRHASIAEVPHIAWERVIGWSTHYLIGIVYAVLYLLVLAAVSSAPSVHSAALFGVGTVLMPWLILQPGIGLGYFATRARKPSLTRLLNLLSHLVFGVGLYVGVTMTAHVA